MNTIVETNRDNDEPMHVVTREEIQRMLAGRFNRRPISRRLNLSIHERAELAAMWAGVATWLAVGTVGIIHLHSTLKG